MPEQYLCSQEVPMDTSLFKAVKEGNCKRVSELTQSHPQILQTVTPLGNTALHVAASRKDRKLAKLLLLLKPCIILVRNTNQETALHKAASAGCLKVVDLLLNFNNEVRCNSSEFAHPEGYDLEGCLDLMDHWRATNVDNETALHYAARGGYVDIVRVLLEKVEGIAIILNKAGESALYTACGRRSLDVIKMLEAKDGVSDTRQEKETYLHQLISIECDSSSDNRDVAFYLLEKRPYLAEKADALGNVPLHLASIAGCLELVEKLLDKRPGMALLKNNDSMAAIHIAARMGYTDIVKCLINNVPECTEVLTKDSKNALHFALEYGNIRTAKTLLDESIDPSFLINHADKDGQTALHKVAMNAELASEILSPMLRISQWNVNAVDNKGLTALDVVEAKVWTAKKPLYRRRLRQSGAHRRVWINLFLDRSTPLLDASIEMDSELQNERKDNLSVTATLIFTATFAAALTVPGGFRSDNGVPVLMHATAFQCFIVSDTLAFCFSILAMFFLTTPKMDFLLIYLRRHSFVFRIGFNRGALTFQIGKCSGSLGGVFYLQQAINATIVSFITGVYVMVAPKSLVLAGTACTIGVFTFFLYYSVFRLYGQRSTPLSELMKHQVQFNK